MTVVVEAAVDIDDSIKQNVFRKAFATNFALFKVSLLQSVKIVYCLARIKTYKATN